MLIPLGILAASGAGVASDYELISSTVLTSNATSVTFSGLGAYSTTYKHLQLRFLARHDANQPAVSLRLMVNGTAISNAHRLRGDRSSVTSSYTTLNAELVYAVGAGNAANSYAANIVDLADAYSTAKNKTFKVLSGWTGDNTTTTEKYNVSFGSGLRLDTTALTSLGIFIGFGNMTSGSRFSLYGIKG
jgi:hypothetical protein